MTGFVPVLMSSPLPKIGIIYTQITVIDSLEPEICTKMFRNLNEKTCCKISCDYISYSMVKIACGKDAFLEIFNWKQVQHRRSITAVKRSERDKMERQKKLEKPKDWVTFSHKNHMFDFCACACPRCHKAWC